MAGLVGPRIVPVEKIVSYLLDVHHVDGGPKARFFLSFGFIVNSPDQLVKALLDHAVLSARIQARGVNRLVRGVLMSPDGRNPEVDVVWFQRFGETEHRLVTAYPA